MFRSLRFFVLGVIAVLLVTTTACASEVQSGGEGESTAGEGQPAGTELAADPTEGSDGTSAASEPAGGTESGGSEAAMVPMDEVGTVVVGSANFTEQLVLGNMFAEILEDRGFQVERQLNLGAREVYFPAIVNGEIDVLAEYLGATYGFLAEDEEVITDVEELREALKSVLPESLVLLESSEAQDQDALAVTQETADEFDLQTVSDLAEVDDQLVAGGPAEEETRAVGLPGLKEVYGIEFQDFVVTDAGGPQTREALQSGRIDVGRVFTTQGFIEEDNLVVLEEDKPLIPAENITPIIREEVMAQELVDALNEVMGALTTENLTNLNFRVDVEKADPQQVAREFLQQEGLIGG